MDKRFVNDIYYIRNGNLMKASLNEMITGNADFADLTEKEWNDYRKGKSQLDAKGRIQNEDLSAFNYSVNQEIVESAQKTLILIKNMRVTRNLKSKKSHAKTILHKDCKMKIQKCFRKSQIQNRRENQRVFRKLLRCILTKGDLWRRKNIMWNVKKGLHSTMNMI